MDSVLGTADVTSEIKCAIMTNDLKKVIVGTQEG